MYQKSLPELSRLDFRGVASLRLTSIEGPLLLAEHKRCPALTVRSM